MIVHEENENGGGGGGGWNTGKQGREKQYSFANLIGNKLSLKNGISPFIISRPMIKLECFPLILRGFALFYEAAGEIFHHLI